MRVPSGPMLIHSIGIEKTIEITIVIKKYNLMFTDPRERVYVLLASWYVNSTISE